MKDEVIKDKPINGKPKLAGYDEMLWGFLGAIRNQRSDPTTNNSNAMPGGEESADHSSRPYDDLEIKRGEPVGSQRHSKMVSDVMEDAGMQQLRWPGLEFASVV